MNENAEKRNEKANNRNEEAENANDRCGRCRNQRPYTEDGDFRMRCLHAMPQYPIKDGKVCEKFDSMYIEFPITIKKIEVTQPDGLSLYKCGSLVRVQPCAEEYQKKTFLGILLGDLPQSIGCTYSKTKKELHVFSMSNPAMFVPELRKIIYGCESWWSRIENPEDLKSITPGDIESTWYVRLLKEMLTAEAGEQEE